MLNLRFVLRAMALCLVAQCVEASVGRFGYMVDCSACYSVPISNVDSYNCKVRCEVEGESSVNLTGIYDMLTQVLTKLDNTTKELEATKQELKDTKQELKEQLDVNKRILDKLQIDVSFTAKLDEIKQISSGETIVYDSVIVNNGDAYSKDDGKFTAPYNGTYQFSVTVMNAKGYNLAYASLMHNGVCICSAYTGKDGGAHQTGLCAVNLNLTALDQVWVTNPSRSIVREYHKDYNKFSGNLEQIQIP